MSSATAAADLSILISDDLSTFWTKEDTEQFNRYIRANFNQPSNLSDSKPESSIHEMRPLTAAWYNAVHRRIHTSILPPGQVEEGDGRWLNRDIAWAAIQLFKDASDVLPGEPFVYSSRKGDLVAEFSAPHGTLTGIVSSAVLALFAVVDGTPIEKRLDLKHTKPEVLRHELQQITRTLNTGRHGAEVEPQN